MAEDYVGIYRQLIEMRTPRGKAQSTAPRQLALGGGDRFIPVPLMSSRGDDQTLPALVRAVTNRESFLVDAIFRSNWHPPCQRAILPAWCGWPPRVLRYLEGNPFALAYPAGGYQTGGRRRHADTARPDTMVQAVPALLIALISLAYLKEDRVLLSIAFVIAGALLAITGLVV